jgi:class 3 adenylate cyclase
MAGSDIRGMAVHIAARVMDAAGAGEVLVSATTTALATGSGIRFADRGDHELRGVTGLRRLFQALPPE